MGTDQDAGGEIEHGGRQRQALEHGAAQGHDDKDRSDDDVRDRELQRATAPRYSSAHNDEGGSTLPPPIRFDGWPLPASGWRPRRPRSSQPSSDTKTIVAA